MRIVHFCSSNLTPGAAGGKACGVEPRDRQHVSTALRPGEVSCKSYVGLSLMYVHTVKPGLDFLRVNTCGLGTGQRGVIGPTINVLVDDTWYILDVISGL